MQRQIHKPLRILTDVRNQTQENDPDNDRGQTEEETEE